MKRSRVINATSERARMAWKITNVANGEAHLDLYDVIGDPWDGVTASDFVKDLRDLGDEVEVINLHINSPGGYVDDALAIYNALKMHPAQVNALIESVAASAASFVAMAADTRFIAKNAKVMIHDALGFGLGNAADMRRLADILDEESSNIASIYAERGGGDIEDWRKRMQANGRMGTTYRGQDAIDIGLADEILTNTTRNVVPGRIAAIEEPTAKVVIPGTDVPVPSDVGDVFKSNASFTPAPTIEELLRSSGGLATAVSGAGGK